MAMQLFCWVEIKATVPTDDEQEKAHRLARHTGKPVYVLFGDITPPSQRDAADDGGYILDGEGWDHQRLWCECLACGAVGLEFQGNADRLCDCERRLLAELKSSVGLAPGQSWWETSAWRASPVYGSGPQTPRLQAAHRAARSARFEHGEAPRRR